VLANQLQRMARYSRRAGATGLAGIPCQWGYKPEHHGWRKGTISDAEYQKLSVLNLDVFQAVMNDPDVDILRVLDRALKRRYGRKLPRALAERLVESQEIKARTYNLRGIRANGENLDRMNYQLMRYAPTFKDWRKRTARTAANVNRVLEENDGNVQRAAELVEEIEAMKGRIPKRVYEDFLASFTCLRETALQGCNRQSVQFLMWAMKDGGIPCNMATIMEIEKRLPSAEWTR